MPLVQQSTRRREDLKILLMQIREDSVTREEEYQAFLRYGSLRADQVKVLDVFQTPHFEASCLESMDALWIGGSSDASVLKPETYPFIRDCERLLQFCVESSKPVFASCFGFQLLVTALGGTVIRDRPNMEMGVYSIQLTPEGQRDPLLGRVSGTSFLAVSGHQERATVLPDSLINLASTPQCPYHAIKLAHKPIYGFQFHPELDAADLKARLRRYQDRYLDDSDSAQAIMDNIQETPLANGLISRFIDLFLLSPAES